MLTINVLGLSNLHAIHLSVQRVCTICGFSERTFFARKKLGDIKVTQSATETTRDHRPRIYVCADDLADYLGCKDEASARERMGLPAIVEEKAEPSADRRIFADLDAVAPRVHSTPKPVQDSCTGGFTDDAAANAAAWAAGEVTDSAGNSFHGNEKWPSRGSVSLIGPHEPMPRVRPDSCSHMDPALIGDVTAPPNPVDSDEFQELLHPGFLERKARMYQEAGLRQPSEQDRKKAVDRDAIAAAFRHGYSR